MARFATVLCLTPARAVRVSFPPPSRPPTKTKNNTENPTTTTQPDIGSSSACIDFPLVFCTTAVISLHGSIFAVSPQTQPVFRVPPKNGQVQGQQRLGRSLCARDSLHFHRMFALCLYPRLGIWRIANRCIVGLDHRSCGVHLHQCPRKLP